ncbi:MAG: hypothetical protein JST59_01780 [Actinobacteria bacterium]|nr:hypothetical protein [Actinomycetota bacterium]
MLERLLDLLPKNRNTMLPTIHEFLREVEGKMIRENVTQFSNIDIEVRYEGKDKFIRLPRNSSIFKLRKLIIKEFGIDPTMNFSMEVCSNRREVSFIEEEDFSVNAIELAMRGPTIKIVEAKGRHPHLAALEQFKEDISCNERIYTLLVDMLSDPASEQEIWEVLELLPKNRNIFDRLQNISVEYDSQKWKVFFEEPSLKKLSYKLKMLSELIANPMWVAAFKATGGFDELSHRLLSFQKKDFSSIDLTKCVCITLSTFFDCLNSSGTKAEDVLLHLKSDQIFKRLMEYLWMPAPPSIMLTNQILRLLLKLMHLKPELSSIFYANSAQIEALVEQGCF